MSRQWSLRESALDSEYPDWKFDVEREQNRLRSVDVMHKWMKMTLSGIINWRAGLRSFPFTLEVNNEVRGKKLLATGSISILFTGNSEYGFEVTNASRGFYRFKNEKMRLSDLLAEIERAGITTITLRGENVRVKEKEWVFMKI